MFDDRYMHMFEGILVVFAPDDRAVPPGFQHWGTVTLYGQQRTPLFLSDDDERVIAGDVELSGLDLLFTRLACKNLQNRRAARENDPRHRSKRRAYPTLHSPTLNSSGGLFS
ncbi:MAG: hypothetical protein KKA22_04005 [Gammaproteobacteria bacterium]|nr:hypothetical protein [Gammaproteobacteria bacterium]MBU1407293.1 hypothetical protein [Gammaproteobacteria bacterium]MBU1531333.1 hypothetical protein [Gammaproteobacteria bacterium]